MDAPEILRILTAVNSRAIRAEKIQGKLDQDLTTTRKALTQVTDELEQVSKLADLIYEVGQRMGAVTDYLLKEHGIQEGSRGSESFEVILNSVVEKTEAQEPKKDAETPSPTAKLLGVVFDQRLRWKEHVQQVIKRATKTAMALSGLRHLRPEQMQQLYQACVAPIVDYASTVCHGPLRDKVHIRHLNTVQRNVLIRILSAFRTVATATLEVEAYILPTHLRLRHRAQRTIARLHTLPRDHPIWSALFRAQNRRNNVGSYARFPLAEALKTMDVDRLNELETINPHPLPPWRPDAFTEIELEPDRETARERAVSAKNTSDIVVYSDASGREGHLGAAIVALNDNDESMWRNS
ncbi:reverse transcriptase [Penicillium brevicompactum]|uniref:Reverse transcriptase n=1 Tax=Penicillium brevicompactum TaxID=5074 RepID=A0A9W9RV07_PENBR|nr:reverse transcriptase [Penicillium brevicompactum]